MGINFPASPTPGQKYPASPVGGLPTYTWDGEKWTTTTSTIEGMSYVQRSGDTMTGHLSLPTAPAAANAVRKDYVDTTSVAKTGDTMSGHLTLPTTPAAANAVRKDYVDTAVAAVDLSSKVSKTGDTMSGHLGLPTGPAAENAVRKDYVDTAIAGIVIPPAGASVAYVDSGDAARIARSGDTMTGAFTINSNQYFGAAAASKFQVYGEGSYPTIAFHAPSYFGANFGMNTDGNFYMGGWSFGAGAAYKFWTTRDFGNNPVNCVINMRQVYAGDQTRTDNYWFSTDLGEPWDGTVITQIASTQFRPDGWVTGLSARYRYMQFQTATGNWYTAPYA